MKVPGADVVGRRAENPSPFTLGGTNSWLIGADGAWVVDPGPRLEPHVESLVEEITHRGGLAGIALTHDHQDHSEAIGELCRHFPDAPLAAARGEVDVRLSGGDRFGPLQAVETPGHSPDHLSYVADDIAFTGDAVLGEGSVFVADYPGALTDYLEGLERLRQMKLRLLLPGHGPVVSDPAAKLDQYISHRLEREQKLLAALDAGARSVEEMLERAWDDAPRELRPAATWTLAAHLDKLASEGRLPDGVQRPRLTG